MFSASIHVLILTGYLDHFFSTTCIFFVADRCRTIRDYDLSMRCPIDFDEKRVFFVVVGPPPRLVDPHGGP